MYKLLSILSILVIISMLPTVLSAGTNNPNQPDTGDTIPSWIKNTAGWWADELIDDSSFVFSIQWLVTNDIIILSPTEQGIGGDDIVIPSWIKSTAGWWADDKIHDVVFVGAIRYLINEGIMVVMEPQVEEAKCNFKGKEVVCSSIEKEVVEINDFYMEVNGGTCSYCVSWAYVGDEYFFQIETYDEQHGKYIDGVEISAKIISKGGELRHDFGEVTTDDGVYKNGIAIPSMDWYAGNILSVTGEYFGVEKTIEKEFEVFKKSGALRGYGSWNSGLKMFIVGNQGDDVNEYTLSVPFDVSSASFVDSFSIASEDDKPSGIVFSKSGLKMFIVGNDGDDVNEYTLSVPFDVSSASFVDSFSIASEESSPSGIAFSKSGEKMFIVGNNGDEVNEYTLSAAWDVSSASFVDSFSVSSQETFPTGIAFSKSGEKMFIVGFAGNDVNEYTLSAAWDVSSASFVDSFSIDGQDDEPSGIAFSKSGEKMFIVGNDGDDVNEYTLSAAWDVSTASFVDSFSVVGQDNTPNDMFL
jgi:hypothetical protein